MNVAQQTSEPVQKTGRLFAVFPQGTPVTAMPPLSVTMIPLPGFVALPLLPLPPPPPLLVFPPAPELEEPPASAPFGLVVLEPPQAAASATPTDTAKKRRATFMKATSRKLQARAR